MHRLPIDGFDEVIDAITPVTSVFASVVDSHVDNRSFRAMPVFIIRISFV
jgi:hypothetical protein